MAEGQKTAQKRQAVSAPLDDLVKIVAGADRPANSQKLNLRKSRKRMRNTPVLTIVPNQPEMIQQNPQTSAAILNHRGLLSIDPLNLTQNIRDIPVNLSS